MNSREKILAAVKKNKPVLTDLPETKLFERTDVELIPHFKEVLESIGGKLVEVAYGTSLEEAIITTCPDMSTICSTIPDINVANVDINITEVKDPHDLKGVDLAIIKGEFGVAENAAIWVTEEDMGQRALPFITQHLAIVLEKASFVWNMHQAYTKLDAREAGFGVFIAGPSKTADIEQSLVIGAHGPRSLSVFLV
ncbi:LUD domain-containing protein [Flammeovirgaceae bacterium SG7u.111]|nr:LUD domain-containing protein [Flammeovirgaceae bacterium SG7u.132]WPO33829.1 LUD domain-containing protein [Flammeovirgaceae bacterium SG7u.111]